MPAAEHPSLAPYAPRPGTIPTLPVPDPATWRALHLIGIGGAGMNGIARLLLARGIAVTGSDLKDSPNLQELRESGATVSVGHRADRVGPVDAVVVSSAIPPANVELRAAREVGVPVLMRAQVLAALMRGRLSVAVSGTHGKTTTTSMVSVMLQRLGRSPTFVIGGDLNESGSGAEHGSGDLFVAEADESDGSFLLLSPDIAVVTNVEEDHLDFYEGGRSEVEAAFATFCAGARFVVSCADDPGARRSLAATTTPCLTYGFGRDADLVLREIEAGGGRARGAVRFQGESMDLELAVGGRHNLLNAGAALGVAARLGVPLAAAAAALGAFTGVRRRYERRGEAAGALFVDDYAHHPTEVEATLRAARAEGRRIVAVFQPHRYTRTRSMWRALGESLRSADTVVVTDVYGAGEQPIPGVNGKLLVDALAEAEPGKPILYLPRRSEVAAVLGSRVRRDDLVLTLGAGDITTVGDEVIEWLSEDLNHGTNRVRREAERTGESPETAPAGPSIPATEGR
ncbi:UDP-N-acetylmuramate--L-alanine ligase [soil metagenome]